MIGIVLAAGRGSRLGSPTEDRPKALVEVGGRSLLDRQRRALIAAGCSRMVVVAGWHADAFEGLAVEVITNPDWKTTSMVESLAVASPLLRAEDALVSYGDIVYTSATARALAACGADIAISYDPLWRALWELRFDDPAADAETFRIDGERLVEVGGRVGDLDEVKGQYMGLIRTTPRGWAELERVAANNRVAHMTGLLQAVVDAGVLDVVVVPAVGEWFEFDRPSDLDLGAAVVARIDLAAGAPPQ